MLLQPDELFRLEHNIREEVNLLDKNLRSAKHDLIESMEDDEIRRILFWKRKELEEAMLRPFRLRTIEPINVELMYLLDSIKEKEFWKELTEYMNYVPELRRVIRQLDSELQRRHDNTKRNWRQELERKKEDVDILHVIESYTNVWRYKPWNLIQCPFPAHKDKSPSFMIYSKNNSFKCFWCNKWWSQIDFILNMEWCDLKSAIEKFLTY